MTKKQNILITGASSGIGAAIAEELLRGGHTVCAIDIRKLPERENLIGFEADITNEAALSDIREELGRMGVQLDIILNVAGIHRMFSLAESELTEMRRLIEINLVGTMCVNRIFHPLLSERGRIVIVTSEVASLAPMPFNGLYSVSKTALDAYAQALRQELNLLGQKVITVRPGAVGTPLATGSLAATEKLAQSTVLYKKQASRFSGLVKRFMGRPIPPQVLARLVVRAAQAKHPRLIYHKHRNPGLILLSLLPLRLQCFVIKCLLH